MMRLLAISLCREVDYKGELAIVIKKRQKFAF